MYENLLKLIQQAETADRIGKIENVVGMSMEASAVHWFCFIPCFDFISLTS